MKETKSYLLQIRFARGSATALASHGDAQSLHHSLWRAEMIPEHRIEVIGRAVAPTPDERELLRRRVDHVVQAAVAAGVSRERIETTLHEDPGAPVSPESGSYVDFAMHPDVASLSGDADDPRLTGREVSLLEEARRVVWVARDADATRALDAQHDRATWRRLFGHDTLTQWAAAGVDHPLYTER